MLSRPTTSEIILSIGLCSLIAIGLIAFWPGLTGPFIFDDFPNLSDLGFMGGVHDWHSALRFIIGGNASQLGRPLSMASFLINDISWPADPYGFKYTNLLIHLLAGVAVFAFIRKLQLTSPHIPTRHPLLPLAATAMWLLSPIQTAPVFLVVQRMTLLSALFVFAGLTMWLYGRERIVNQQAGGWRLITLSVCVGTLLATLSKENGALLPLFILITEGLLAPLPLNQKSRIWKYIFLWMPSLMVVGYLISTIPSAISGTGIRDFTFSQRLTIEPLILFEYLKEIFIPGINTTILRDDISVNTTPITLQLAAVFAWIVIFITAFRIRNRAPIVSWAVFFYLIGHILESSVIQLELFFIHRNYVPMLGPLFAITYYVTHFLERKPYTLRLITVVYVAVLAVLTRITSGYWGDELRLLLGWADQNPASVRAAEMSANYWGIRGEFQRSIDAIERTLPYNPQSITLNVGDYYEHCLLKQENKAIFDHLIQIAPTAPFDLVAVDSIGVLVTNINSKTCTQISNQDVIKLLKLLGANPKFNNVRMNFSIGFAIAGIQVQDEQLDAAIETLQGLSVYGPTVYTHELLGDLLAAKGRYGEAAKAYREALGVEYFNGWRKKLFPEKPEFPEIEQKAKAMEAAAALQNTAPQPK